MITQPKFRMWLRPDGVVQLVWAPRVTVALEDAIQATAAMAQLTGGRQSPLLVDARDIGLAGPHGRDGWHRCPTAAGACRTDSPGGL